LKWRDFSGKFYDAAVETCAAHGERLCSFAEYCPNGPGADVWDVRGAGSMASGDKWAPIADLANDWVQVADARKCQRHLTAARYLPAWGVRDMPDTGRYTTKVCCAAEEAPEPEPSVVCGAESGDGTGGREEQIGRTETMQACAEKVARERPDANGVTWSSKASTCYA